MTCQVCGDLRGLCEMLEEGAGAIVLTEEALGAGDCDGLDRVLAAQREWSDVPIVVMTDQGADSPAALRAIERLGNVTVMERPVRTATLISALRASIRARRRQYELRDRLEEQRASEERFRLAADAVNGLIYEQDPRIETVIRTRGLHEIVGYHPGDVPATLDWWIEQIHPEDRSRAVESGLRLGPNRPFLLEYRVRHEDGRWIQVEDRAVVVRDGRGRPEKIVGCTTDVTERKEAELSLRRNEAEFRSLFEMAGVGNTEIDLRSGRFVRVNRRYCEMLGYTAEELLSGMTFLEITHPDDRDWNLKAITPFLEDQQESFELEKRYVRKDGSTIWVHLSGRLLRDHDGRATRMLGSAIDITDRRQAQEALRTRTAQLDFTLAATGVGMWLNTLPLGRLNWDARTKELFFIPPEVVPTIELFFNRLHPEDREPTRLAAEAAIRDRTLYAIDHRAVEPETGVVRWIRSVGQATYDKAGTPIRFDGLNYDITERKRQEEELRRAAAELAEGDRRKDEFLATLAHELRNPLAPVRNAVEILQLTGPTSTDLEWATELIDRQMRQMTRLIDDLLDVSRITRGKLEIRKEIVDLARVVDNAIEISRPMIEEQGHALHVSLPGEPVLLEGDMTRLAQVFLNLLTNAAKYTDRGGCISLTARRLGKEVNVAVKDTGIGIPADKLPTLFEMFSQVEGTLSRSRGGLGIGLCLVKNLVGLHGGTIEASSLGLGTGSEFLVRLPVVEDSRELRTDSGRKDPAQARSSMRVLVVDDNQDAADSLARMLLALGNEVRTAYDGEEAVAAVSEFRPALVLLDLGLPRLNGYEACRSIREQSWGKSIAIVAVTGWGQDEDRRRSREAGFDRHFVKPVDPRILKKLLEDLELEPVRVRPGFLTPPEQGIVSSPHACGAGGGLSDDSRRGLPTNEPDSIGEIHAGDV